MNHFTRVKIGIVNTVIVTEEEFINIEMNKNKTWELNKN